MYAALSLLHVAKYHIGILISTIGLGGTVIWLCFVLKIFRTLLFRAVLISYAPHIIYETRVKVSLLKNILAFNFRTDGSVRN